MSRSTRCILALVIGLVLLSGCGSSASSAQSQVVNWESLGCPEPTPLIVETSEAMETDVGLAAESVAAEYDISTDEAKRRLRLQQILGERMAEVRASETGRVAEARLQHDPHYAAVVTLTGTEPVRNATEEILCRTPELEVRLGGAFTESELVGEVNRLAPTLFDDFGPELTSIAPRNGQLEFDVTTDDARDRLDELLTDLTDYPYVINSAGFAPPEPVPPSDLPGMRAHSVRTGSGMDAIVGGVVSFEDSCVWLAGDGGTRNPVIWPVGTVGLVDPDRIVLPDGQVAMAGDAVHGGGGYVDSDRTTDFLGLEPFPAGCTGTGQAAVFNSDSPIEVTADIGVPFSETLVERFTLPQPIGLELIAVNPNERSVAVIDFVTGTVHQYSPDDYTSPPDAISGASGGGGFIHLWSGENIFSYGGQVTRPPVEYQPDPVVRVDGYAPVTYVVPAPDGERTWLVQPAHDVDETQIELVNLVEERLTRISSARIDGLWSPAGTTVEGLVLQADDRVILVDSNGSILGEQPGTALSVGWSGAALLRTDGTLVTTNPLLGDPNTVTKPGDATWGSVGDPIIPSAAPPLRTGTDKYLVRLGTQLVVVRRAGNPTVLYDMAVDHGRAVWSRGGDWVAVMVNADVTLLSVENGEAVPLGSLVPEEYWVLSAG